MSEQRWRVTRVDRTRVVVVPDAGGFHDGDVVDPATALSVPLLRGGVLEQAVGEPTTPAVGDRVQVLRDGVRYPAPPATPTPPTTAPTDVRVLLLPRTAELVRDSVDRTSRSQVIAANVDLVLVVEPLDPQPAVGRVERLVTLAWRSGAVPLVVLTKTDLATDAEDWIADLAAAAPGVEVLALSALTRDGLEELRRRIPSGATLVVVGPSGAGKSTLVNALVGHEVMATGERRGDGKGRHTTTHRELTPLALPDGGHAWLIDTPGLRAVGLVADTDAVSRTFADVAALAEQCRFADCSHEREPDCAVAAALADGTLSPRRHASWRAQQREAHHAAVRADARLAAAERDEWRRRTVAMREHHRVTGKGRR